MPPEGSPDTPMAVMLADDAPEAPAPEAVVEPQRRRVRRKAGTAAVETEAAAPSPEPVVDVVEAMPEPQLDTVADEPELVAAEPEAVVPTEPSAAPIPEADLSAIIANDPAQITAPAVKPKRGWWRL
jgi:ribonuclease E